MEANEKKRFWIAHARGPNFTKLREKGFTTFYPSMDDYVFLEVKPENEKLLRKQTELGVAFLKEREQYVTIDNSQMLRMFVTTSAKIGKGAEILAVEGSGSNLEGIVLEVSDDGEQLKCSLRGYNRTYEVWLDRLEVVEKPKDATDGPDIGGGCEPADLCGL